MILNRGQGKNFNAGVYEWIYLYLSGGGAMKYGASPSQNIFCC
jgi:hypothetical protein